MNVAYIDTSYLVAIAFDEPGARSLGEILGGFDRILSSNLLEAELRSAAAREGESGVGDLLERVTWLLPDRPLTAEITRALRAGHLRGADLWHVACALMAPDPAEITFLTLDQAQNRVAAAGLAVRALPPPPGGST